MVRRERSGARTAMAPRSEGVLVGRAEVVEQLIAAAADARDGSGSIVLLTGEAGIGKTSVARALARKVGDDLTVSWGSCTPDGSAPPFWPWRTVITPDPSPSPQGLDRSTDLAIGSRRFERLNELRDALFARAQQEPRLHIIEDVQWADVASILLLAHVGTAVMHEPLLVVATLRTGEPLAAHLAGAVEDVRRTGRVSELQPLADADVAVLIRQAGIDPDADLMRLVQSRARGNPLFVSELLRAVRATPRERRVQALARDVPTRVSEVVADTLARLPPAVAEVLTVAAVFGPEGDVRSLAAARGSTAASVLDLLEQARAARLLDAAPAGRWRFRHELVRDAVYSTATATDRAVHHGAVLAALATDASTPPAVLAHHALAAQPLFDADRAVALAARAGESAVAQHADEEVVRWFERALDAAPASTSDRWRAELLVACGEAHRNVGNIENARRAFLEGAALTDDPALLARAALGYADPGADLGIAYRSDNPVTPELLDRAIAAQPVHDSVTTVVLEARLGAELYFSDDPARARRLAESAVERARRLGDRHALGAAVAVAHDAFAVGQRTLAEQLSESEELLAWAHDSGSAAALLAAHRARVFDLLAAGDIAAMDAEVVAFRRVAEPLRAPGYLWWPRLWSAMRALLEGRHDEAEGRALAAYELGATPFPSLAMVNLSFLLFFLRREQGRFGEMEAAVREAVSRNADVPALRVGLTFLLAELGRVEEVRGMLTALDDHAFDRLHDRNWPASWFQLARAAAVVGDEGVAATLLHDRHQPSELCVMVSLATVCLGAVDLARAWLHHTLGDLDAADACYRVAATVNSAIGAQSWLAQTHADHARLLLDRDGPDDRERAGALTELAATGADRVGLASLTGTIAGLRAALNRSQSVEPALRSSSVFRRQGPVWDVRFAGRAAQVPHARGLADVRFLLANPGQAVHVTELTNDAGTATGATGGPVFDARARQEIRERLRMLDAEIADAEAAGDGTRAARARDDLQALAESVARGTGLGGRTRRLDDPVERARKTVSTRIRRAVRLVAREHPELGRHLDRSIDTGTWCAYRPAEPVHWQT